MKKEEFLRSCFFIYTIKNKKINVKYKIKIESAIKKLMNKEIRKKFQITLFR